MTDTTITGTTTIAELVDASEEARAATLGDGWSELDDETKAALVIATGRIRAAIARLKEEQEAIEEILLTAPVGAENAETIAGFRLGVKQGSTFDAAAFGAKFDAAEHGHLFKSVPDLAEIKRFMAPVELKAFYKPSAPSIDFKAV